MEALAQRHEPLADRKVSDLYRHRKELSLSERTLLELIQDLSGHGFAWAGKNYMAQALNISTRQIKRLIASLNAKGYLAVTYRKGKTSLYKIREAERPEQRQPTLKITQPKRSRKFARRGTSMSPPPGTSMSPPGGTSMSPNNKNLLDSSADGAADVLFNEQSRRFNPLRPAPRNGCYDDRSPERRLADAFKAGMVLFVQYECRSRAIVKVMYNNTDLLLTLASDSNPEATEDVCIPLLKIGSTPFWR